MDNIYELVYLSQMGDLSSIDSIIRSNAPFIYYKARNFCKNTSFLIDDYVNEGRYSLYNAIISYRWESKFFSYFDRCLTNCFINFKKKNEQFYTCDYEYNDIVGDPLDSMIEEYNYSSLKKNIINHLSFDEELVLNLKECNFSNKEIAEITDNKIKTVYNINNRIKNKVYKIMSNNI